MRPGSIIFNYIVRAVFPFFIFSWLLLSVILFVQQASRFSDIFFGANIPTNLIWQLTLALIPNVIAFTCPMAVLVGVIVGLTKMQTDSELTVIRAIGINNRQLTLPILLLGVALSAFAFLINIYGVPFASSIVRKVALQTALYKLESPITPGVFNNEVNGYIIYVKDGDIEKGQWSDLFIYNQSPDASVVRLITAKQGRLDYLEEKSELVLDNAEVLTITKENGEEKIASENVESFRFGIQTGRAEIIKRLTSADGGPEELGLIELANYARQKEGKDKIEANILWQRRVMLSITPLIFCLLGTALSLRYSRHGRGFGIALAIAGLILYYLLAFLGEQMARTERISTALSGAIPILVSVIVIVWFYRGNSDGNWIGRVKERIPDVSKFNPFGSGRASRKSFLGNLSGGIRDLDLVINIGKYYVLTLIFLVSIFIIFTAFELWKFAGTMENGFMLLINYLLYLLPFIYLQLSPSAAMIAILTTYVIKSRQNEIVTWTAAGESVYRLLVPALGVMVLVGLFNWVLQEQVLPYTNRMQDNLRGELRSRGILNRQQSRDWIANEKGFISFKTDTSASDNETAVADLNIYEFDNKTGRLQNLYHSDSAIWDGANIELDDSATVISIDEGKISRSSAAKEEIAERVNPFSEATKKPSHLNMRQVRAQITNSEADVEKRLFIVALEKKRSTPILPIIIALFTAPFALSLSRKGKVLTIGYAVGLWLVYMGLTSSVEQLGLNGYISPALAVWGPIACFFLFGTILMTRIKT